MNEEMTKWVDALRSGDYSQWRPEPDGFCVPGVLTEQSVAVKRRCFPLRRVAKWVGIGLLLFVVSFTWSLLAFQAGERHGIRYEEQRQVADYNDGWQDGQQDLIDRAWNMHYAGKPESR